MNDFKLTFSDPKAQTINQFYKLTDVNRGNVGLLKNSLLLFLIKKGYTE